METLEWVVCELCKENDYDILIPDFELALEQKRAYELCSNFYARPLDEYVKASISYIQSYPSNLVRCKNCGLAYRNPKPPAEFLLNKYRREKFTEEYDVVWKASWERIFIRQLKHIESIAAKGRLLDLGSQLGLLPELAFKRSWDAFGIDISDYTVQRAADRGVKVFHGQLADIDFPSGYFDVLTIMLLFENLPHFPLELSEAFRILKPGGLIFIKVANVNFYLFLRKLSSFMKINKLRQCIEVILCRFHLMGFPYQFGFTRQTLKKALSLAGFRAIRVRNYWSVSALDPSLKSKVRYVERVSKLSVNLIAAIVYWLSFRRLNIAPWLEISAYKPSILV